MEGERIRRRLLYLFGYVDDLKWRLVEVLC